MSVNKIVNPPSQGEAIDKINEIIDNLGGSGLTQGNGINITGDTVSTDTDYINNSKALTTGNVSNNSEIYNNTIDKLHTTFDKSKFTYTRNPIVTDDGIVSGFGNTTNVSPIVWISSIINFNAASSWKVKGSFITNSAVMNADPTYVNRMIEFTHDFWYGITVYVSDGKFYAQVQDSNLTNLLPKTDFYNNTVIVDTKYFFSLEFTGTTYIVKCGTSYNNLIEVYKTNTTTKVTGGLATQTIGSLNDGSGGYLGSIDLKYLTIELDGVEVFSGNKTGVDTIKPDNYTVVGTPTITSDGIASGFSGNYSSGSYLTIPMLDVTKKNYRIDCVLKGGNFIFGNSGNQTYRLAVITSGNPLKLTLFAGTGSTWDVANTVMGNTTIDVNKTYKVSFVRENGSAYKVLLYDFETQIETTEISVTSNSDLASSSIPMYIGASGWTAFYGSIDLNEFKIYVDGNLIYQLCLKIPYTLTSSKDKIVDSYYIERVQDTYNQFGQALYYTIDEDNQTFTLPMGDIYGFLTNLQMQIGDVETLLQGV